MALLILLTILCGWLLTISFFQENRSKQFEKSDLIFEGIFNRNPDIVRKAIQQGADVNSTEYSGKPRRIVGTPLHAAALFDQPLIVEMLLKNGASVNLPAKIWVKNPSSKADLLEIVGATPLHCAAFSGADRIVSVLLENGAFIDSQTALGMTPIYLAAWCGHSSVVKILLKKGANAEQAFFGITPRKIAEIQGDNQVLDLFREKLPPKLE